MKQSLLLTSLIVLSCTACAFAQETVDEPGIFQREQIWTFIPGAEFPPGGNGSFTLTTEGDLRIGVLAYDFSKGGTYVAGQTSVAVAEGYSSFNFRAKAAQPLSLGVRLIDSTNQVHQTTLSYNDAGRWQAYRIDLKDKSAAFFNGAKDGVIHYPIKNVLLIVNRTDAPGDIHFSSGVFVK